MNTTNRVLLCIKKKLIKIMSVLHLMLSVVLAGEMVSLNVGEALVVVQSGKGFIVSKNKAEKKRVYLSDKIEEGEFLLCLSGYLVVKSFDGELYVLGENSSLQVNENGSKRLIRGKMMKVPLAGGIPESVLFLKHSLVADDFEVVKWKEEMAEIILAYQERVVGVGMGGEPMVSH